METVVPIRVAVADAVGALAADILTMAVSSGQIDPGGGGGEIQLTSLTAGSNSLCLASSTEINVSASGGVLPYTFTFDILEDTASGESIAPAVVTPEGATAQATYMAPTGVGVAHTVRITVREPGGSSDSGIIVISTIDPATCNDHNPCTNDACVDGACRNLPNSNACSDGNVCTVGDTCSNGICVGGARLNCNDNNVCTTDLCNPASGCQYLNNSDACDDGVHCNGDDTCAGGSCSAHAGDPCAAPEYCDENTDACVECLSDTHCDDGDVCTNDSCAGGTCSYTDNDGVVCDDGLFCTATDECLGGACVGSGDACPGQMCNDDTDACVDCISHADCTDGEVCTDDFCDADGQCFYTNNSNACDDTLFCTAVDSCSGGSCVGSGDPCLGQLCDEVNDRCVECLGDADCDDGNVCTNDFCVGGTCSYTDNDGAVCDDGLFCTTTGECAGGVCVGSGDACPGQMWQRVYHRLV